MKLKELKKMGRLESRIYYRLHKMEKFGYPDNYNGLCFRDRSLIKELNSEIDEMEIGDILKKHSEEEIMKMYGFGDKCMQRLKELV